MEGEGGEKTRKITNRGSMGNPALPFPYLSRLCALTFNLSPIPGPYEEIKEASAKEN